jgi:hypothetical protein
MYSSLHPSKGPHREAKAKIRIPRRDLWVAPVCEGGLILVVSLAAWLSREPLIFASLGPTAFEQIETPLRPSARPYNVVVGHLIAVVAGFVALYLTRAWAAPAVSAGHIAFARVAAAVVSAALTVLGTLFARATQPAALATTLLVSLGLMQRWQDVCFIMLAVLMMTAVGEPLRRWQARKHGGLDASPARSVRHHAG